MKTQSGAPCSGTACDLWIDDTSECHGITSYNDAFDNEGTICFFCSDDCYWGAICYYIHCLVCKRDVYTGTRHTVVGKCDKCDFECKIGDLAQYISARVPDAALARAHYYNVQNSNMVVTGSRVSVLIRVPSSSRIFARANPAHAIGAALLILAATRFDKGSLLGQGLPMDVARLVARRVFAHRFAREWLELDLL